MIKKVLIANRGEIALRIMKTLRKMDIQSVAVYSEADRNAPFVLYADEAVLIGPPPSSESYLQADRIIEVALDKKCDAIHPGYGFLSENAAFAQAVAEQGIIFIGPSPSAIAMMGSKLEAKVAAKAAGAPLVPGSDTPINDPVEAKRIAGQIGYPVLLKAAAGGGGKGMRVVESENEFEEQLERASSEALSSFGDDAVFIEKYVQNPRHIEIQILADKHGNAIHLNERECSIQRRHQKVIEEAPSAVLDDALREIMGSTAVKIAKACGYSNAGTVEFLVDSAGDYYFLEMNTRLQVEHPVTEWITGIDLVEEQIYIAEGQPLRYAQSDISISGHAIELRVYAEDPANNFLPSTGFLSRYRPPKGPGIRVDDGFREGMEVPVYYDPLLSKLIAFGSTRAQAIAKMKEAIARYEIEGIASTLDFGAFVIQHPAFESGKYDTRFIDKYYTAASISDKDIAAIAVSILEIHNRKVQTIHHKSDTWQLSRNR